MPIKRFNNQTFQYRQAVRKIRNISGLGIIRRSDTASTNAQIIKRLRQREAQQIKSISTPAPTISNETINAYNRLFEGKGSFDDFRQTQEYKQLITQYGTDRGFDAAQVTYYDILLGSGKLTPKEVEDINRKRNSVLRDFYKKTKFLEKKGMSSLQRKMAFQEKILLKQQLSEINKAGFSVDIPKSRESGRLITDFSSAVKKEFARPGGFSSAFGYANTPLFDTRMYSNYTGMSSSTSPYRYVPVPSMEQLFTPSKRKKSR